MIASRSRTSSLLALALAGAIAVAGTAPAASAAPRLSAPVLGASAGTAPVAAGPASAATTDGGVAWTVQTADNANGTGRGNFGYEAQPGAVIQDAMVVTNTGTVPLPLAVYAADAFTASSGEIDVLVDGTPSVGSGTWVTVEPTSLDLAPGQQAEVAFTIAVPADARPGDHSAGIVTSLSTQDAGQTLSVDRRLGTRINVRIAGDLVPAATVSGVTASYAPSWNPFAPGTLTLAYSVENSGNTRITGTETVFAGGPAGLFGTTSPAAQLSEVIPGSTIDVRRDVEVLSLGWVAGAVTIAPEGVGLGAGSVSPIEVGYSVVAVPFGLLLLFAVVAGIGVTIWLVLRRRARSAAAAAGSITDAAAADR